MLSLSRNYVRLMRAKDLSLANDEYRKQHYPHIPLQPFQYTVMGRMFSLGIEAPVGQTSLTTLGEIHAIRTKTVVKKGAKQDLSDEAIALQLQSDAPWMREISEAVNASLDSKMSPTVLKYSLFEDLHHANSISRFHLLFKRESGGAYFVKDLGSMNGLYLDDVKVRHNNWCHVREGCVLRFAPSTHNSRAYKAAFDAADKVNAARLEQGMLPVKVSLPLTPLAMKDIHLEYTFNAEMSDEARHVALHGHPQRSPEVAAKQAIKREDQDIHTTPHAPSTTGKRKPCDPLEDVVEEAASKKQRVEEPAAHRWKGMFINYQNLSTAAAASLNKEEAAAAAAVSSDKEEAAAVKEDDVHPIEAEDQKEAFISELKDEWTCPICVDLIIDCRTLSCGHSFCGHCLANWFEKEKSLKHKKTCPHCRAVHRGTIVANLAGNSTIDRLVAGMSESNKRDRANVIEHLATAARVKAEETEAKKKKPTRQLQRLANALLDVVEEEEDEDEDEEERVPIQMDVARDVMPAAAAAASSSSSA